MTKCKLLRHVNVNYLQLCKLRNLKVVLTASISRKLKVCNCMKHLSNFEVDRVR